MCLTRKGRRIEADDLQPHHTLVSREREIQRGFKGEKKTSQSKTTAIYGGLTKRPVKNWAQGDRSPTGILCALGEKDSQAVTSDER